MLKNVEIMPAGAWAGACCFPAKPVTFFWGAIMTEKQCKLCEKPIPKPRRGPVGDYCSPACKQKAYRRRELERKRRLLSQRPR
jgi:uncharacterized Zn finger protein (UPF0148 family)